MKPGNLIVGLNEGIFPTIKADTKPKLEEERRLAYVAMTRAKDELILSVPRNIVQAGQSIRVDVNQVVQTSKKYFNISY